MNPPACASTQFCAVPLVLVPNCTVSWVCNEPSLCPTPWYTHISFGRKPGLTGGQSQCQDSTDSSRAHCFQMWKQLKKSLYTHFSTAKWILFLNTNAVYNVYCIRTIAISQSYWNRLSLVEKQWTKFSLLILWYINPNQGKMTYWKGGFTGCVVPSVKF